MKIEFFKKKDFLAGLIFVFFGLVAVLQASNYAMGTAAQMGPGYLPYIFGGVLILLGLIISFRSLWVSGELIGSVALRPLLFVTFAVVAFTLMIAPFGLVLSTLALVVIGSLGGFTFNFREVVILYLVLITLAAGLFVYLLKVSFRVWP